MIPEKDALSYQKRIEDKIFRILRARAWLLSKTDVEYRTDFMLDISSNTYWATNSRSALHPKRRTCDIRNP